MEKKVNQELYKKLKKVNSVLRVEKNKLLEERTALKKWGNDLSRLNELSKAIVGTLDTDKIVITAFTKMQEIVPHDVSSVVLFKQKKLWVLSPMKLYVDDTEDENNYKIEVKCLNDVEAETSVFNSRISNRLIFPMEIGDMRIGALHLIRKPDEPFSEHEQKLAAMIVSTLTLALRNSEIHREVQELATIDSLTGLFNNRYFHEILTREFKGTMRYQNPVSLIMIDLDNFKQINDQYGHQAGDTVLREISNRLTRSLREIDVPARYGGDEIAIILPETLIEPAFFVAKRIKTLIEAQPVKFKENNINVTASLGIASCPDPKMRSVEDMIAVADKALYDAKKYGRNRIEVNKDIFIQDNAYLGPLVF